MTIEHIPPVRTPEGEAQNRIQRIPGQGYRIGGKPLAHNWDPYRSGRYDPKVPNRPYGVGK